MESKKANLLIEISKNIVKQYRDQLARNIEINKILSDYEKSIFDGVISDDKILRAIYTENGREYQELLYYEPIPSKEERNWD